MQTCRHADMQTYHTLHYITLHYTTLHYIALQGIRLHYITYIFVSKMDIDGYWQLIQVVKMNSELVNAHKYTF